MAIARTILQYLTDNEVPFDVLMHPHSASSVETAHSAHVSGEFLAKSVLLEDDLGYVMAVVPAVNRLDLGELHRQLNRRVGLAAEPELAGIFEDCELGALPALGQAYGVTTLVDDQLAEQPDIYFDAGDHEHLVHISGEHFAMLMSEAQFGRFSHHT